MRIGLLVDGQAEFQALPYLLDRISTPHTLLRPLYCDIQPFATPEQIALASSKRFPLLIRKHVDLIVILVDKESRPECTGELAASIQREARHRLSESAPDVRINVVLKVTKFENWLVAAPSALRRLPGLFGRVESIARQVANGRADAVAAIELLKGCSHQRHFDKTSGAVAICRHLEPINAARSSRSFAKLLRVFESPLARSRARARHRRPHS